MSKTGSIYLSRGEYERLKEVCEKEGCTAYSLIKRVVLDHINAYPREKPPAVQTEDIKPDLEETSIKEVAEPEAAMADAGGLSENVRKILEGKVDE